MSTSCSAVLLRDPVLRHDLGNFDRSLSALRHNGQIDDLVNVLHLWNSHGLLRHLHDETRARNVHVLRAGLRYVNLPENLLCYDLWNCHVSVRCAAQSSAGTSSLPALRLLFVCVPHT